MVKTVQKRTKDHRRVMEIPAGYALNLFSALSAVCSLSIFSFSPAGTPRA